MLNSNKQCTRETTDEAAAAAAAAGASTPRHPTVDADEGTIEPSTTHYHNAYKFE